MFIHPLMFEGKGALVRPCMWGELLPPPRSS